MVGRTISHYEILEKIGEGGMGIVYRATDTRLNRRVALKFLREDALGNGDHKARFVREARTAAALDHPNICTVYEIGEEDDQIFISMAYIRGIGLDRVIEAEPLAPEAAVDIAIQIARGLEAAHEKGIYHCDIKTSNIVLAGSHHVRITDFGLARIADEIEQRRPTTPGTMAYMSPEQVRGEVVDRRTDIWSLGVCMYEMLSGKLPFTGEYPDAVFYTILNEQPAPLSSVRPGIPSRLERLIARAMSKHADDRFQSASEMERELEIVRRELRDGPRRASTTESPSIAVLPFSDMSPDGDQEFFCDGISEEIINALNQIEGLRVVARTSAFAFKGRNEDIREIGRSLDVTSILEGSVRKSGDMLRITAQLIHVEDGFHLWSERFDRKMEDIFAIQDEIARAIVKMLEVKLVGERKALVRRYTDNLDAYTSYLQGRYYWNKRTEEGLEKGLSFFEQAIAKDPEYALAYAGLADSYNLLGFYGVEPPRQVYPRAEAAAGEALRMDETMAEAYASLGFARMFYDWDWPRAEEAFLRAIELNPDCSTAHHWYAEYMVLVGRGQDAAAQSRKALESDPLSLIINTLLGWVPHYERRYDEAVAQHYRTLEMDPGFVPAHFFLGLAFVQKSMFEEALAEFRRAASLFGKATLFYVVQGYAHAMAGDREEAAGILDRLSRSADGRYIHPYYTAAVHAALRDEAQTFEWLGRASEERDTWMAFLGVDPIWDPIRSDERFARLVRRVGLE
jgi:serine/threonine-protein kinase